MKAVNDATRSTLDQFREKAKDIPWSAHPYAMLVESRKNVGVSEWTEEAKKEAMAALVLWVTVVVGKSTATTLNEILALMRIANESENEEHKKACENMAGSMNFVERVFTNYMTDVDFEYVAEQLFEDGERAEKERAEEFAAAEAAKAKVAKNADNKSAPQAKSGTIHKRWEPSQN